MLTEEERDALNYAITVVEEEGTAAWRSVARTLLALMDRLSMEWEEK